MKVEQIKELRLRTKMGIMECKQALEEAQGNLDAAIEILKQRGATDRRREPGWHRVFSYNHGGRFGTLVELSCESDFVARTEIFNELGKDLCVHVTAANPKFLTVQEALDSPEAAEELRRLSAAANPGKWAAVAGPRVSEALSNFISATVLLEQPLARDQGVTVGAHIDEVVKVTREVIRVRRFMRFVAGES
ncbi:MAG: elongation factor Ts [Planctomycetota bacterium]|jgi:elongation factor Ts